jgi:uncharacterized membrane protein YkoI
MTASMIRAVGLAVLAMLTPSFAAADELVCLNRQEQRAAIASGQAIPLAQAVRSVRGSVRARGSREVVKARLCKHENGLVYVLTVLARDGKVSRATIDAGSGRLVEAH